MSDGPEQLPDEVAESLRAAGRLTDAAAAYRRRGDLVTAEKLYADVWDFATAAEVAHERGDRPAELGHLLSANDPVRAAQVAQEIERGGEADLRRAAEAFERHRRFAEAGALRERLGELQTARELYRRGQSLLDVARLERALGRIREAGLAYEQLIAQDPDGAEAQRARVQLGQLLVALGRPEEAARHLQAARRRAPDDAVVLEELMVAIGSLGWDAGADELHDELVAKVPGTPSRAAIVERHRPAPVEGATRLAGRYELERLLGAGASGRVFLARDTLSGRTVAVKALAAPHEERARESWARYYAEARLVGSLRHPNVVEILDVDEAQGLVVMEHVAGGTLFDRLYVGERALPAEQQPLADGLVKRLLLDVLDALSAVHARGVVHRDLKPANLFFTPTGDVKVGDFGAAHLFSEEATQTAGFVGTLAYMAPEQMSGGAVDFTADLYALGAIAFHALTGRLPFVGPDFVGQHLNDPPPRPTALAPRLDPAWDELVIALLQKDPRARIGSDDEVRRRVAEIAVRDVAPVPARGEHVVAHASASPRYVASSVHSDGAGGPVSLGTDTRLGRAVLVERLPADYLASPAGSAHLAWLRAFAHDAGPRVQRLFALAPRDDGGVDAVFEAPAAGAVPLVGAHRLVTASLTAVHARGVAHGSIATSLVHEPFGPRLLLAGRAPREGATVEGDLAALT
ncbi:MAG: protein kinase [Polyangia bacterium]